MYETGRVCKFRFANDNPPMTSSHYLLFWRHDSGSSYQPIRSQKSPDPTWVLIHSGAQGDPCWPNWASLWARQLWHHHHCDVICEAIDDVTKQCSTDLSFLCFVLIHWSYDYDHFRLFFSHVMTVPHFHHVVNSDSAWASFSFPVAMMCKQNRADGLGLSALIRNHQNQDF